MKRKRPRVPESRERHPGTPAGSYEIRFYREPGGSESVNQWIQRLDSEQRGQLIDYLACFLRPTGPRVVERAGHDDPEIARSHGRLIEAYVDGQRNADASVAAGPGSRHRQRARSPISLRVFFCADEGYPLVILDGYDRQAAGDQTRRVLERAGVRYKRWRSAPRSHME